MNIRYIRGIPLIFRETQVGEIIHPHIPVQWDTRVGTVCFCIQFQSSKNGGMFPAATSSTITVKNHKSPTEPWL